MPQTRTNWIILIVVIAILGGAWIGGTRVTSNQLSAVNPDDPSPDIGKVAPDFTLLTPEGEAVSLSDLRGTPVLLNFWATWCPPCRAEIPALERVSRELGEDVVILGVDVQESTSTVQQFIDEYGMTYPVVLDPDAEVSRVYRVRAFPTTYFIDEQGVVVDISSGALSEPLLYLRMTELMGR